MQHIPVLPAARNLIGGVWRKILVAHLKLCYSRAFVVQAYPTQSHEMLFDAHARAFAALGGIPKRGIYDNMKTAVDKVQKGKGRIPGSWKPKLTAQERKALTAAGLCLCCRTSTEHFWRDCPKNPDNRGNA